MTTSDSVIVTIDPPKPPAACEIAKYAKPDFSTSPGYGYWRHGSGLNTEKRFDIMPRHYETNAGVKSRELLSFFTISDIHITDKETPAQAVYYGYRGGSGSFVQSYSGANLYTTHVLDAAVQTINALHDKHPFNFGLSLGDACNSSQYNELRWFIDVLDGKRINPDSGKKDDPVPGLHNDYQDIYQAAGLNKSIPWYQVLGNHDHFWEGTYPPSDFMRKTVVGNKILEMYAPSPTANSPVYRLIYTGTIDGSTPYGDVIGVGEVGYTPAPAPVPADLNRRFLKRDEWIKEFFNTASNPKGHGFSSENVKAGFACYTFEPVSKLPLKVIVLDDTQRDNDPPVPGSYGHSSLDEERYTWLLNELDKGQKENKLMIIAAHAPIGVGSDWWNPKAPITEAQLIGTLHAYPNLILWVAGHRHQNNVTALPSPDPSKPELGFWEVETTTLRDFPQEFRTFSINLNNDNTISIVTTNVDPVVFDPAGKKTMAATSRSYSIAAEQLDLLEVQTPYNAELFKQLTKEMQKKLRE